MKFKLHADSGEFLTCDACAAEDFELLPGKRLSAAAKYKHFLFYGCPNCREAGFWVHQSTIDEKLDFGIAIARRRATGARKTTAAGAKR